VFGGVKLGKKNVITSFVFLNHTASAVQGITGIFIEKNCVYDATIDRGI